MKILLLKFFANEMVIVSVDLNKISLDDVNFYENYPEAILHVRLLAWRNKFQQSKALKNDTSKKLMPVAWHPTRWWGWCLSEYEQREKEPLKEFLIDEN